MKWFHALTAPVLGILVRPGGRRGALEVHVPAAQSRNEPGKSNLFSEILLNVAAGLFLLIVMLLALPIGLLFLLHWCVRVSLGGVFTTFRTIGAAISRPPR